MTAPTAEQMREFEAIANGETPKPKKPPFIPKQLADELTAETPVAAAESGALHVFTGGAYRPGGEQRLRARIAQKLGDDWKVNKEREGLGYLAASVPRLWAEPPRDRINCRNGILDLETMTLEPHSPDFLSPVQVGAAYDPEATCPAIERFLGGVLAEDLVPVAIELAGYLVTPDNRLQTAVMLLGEGANGKSVFLELLRRLIGPQNVSNVALQHLDEHRFAAAELEGKLANIFADLDARALQSSGIFKSITGNDPIMAERKNRDPFHFTPYARLLFSANEPPGTPDSTDAFFRRWLILPFERRFDGNNADRSLIDKLSTPQELSGLLNLGLAALPELRARGAFRTAKSAQAAADRFRVDSDSVAGFIADSCEIGPEQSVARSSLFDAYKNWCFESNRKPLGKQRFNRRVEARYPSATVGPVQGIQTWRGIGLGVGT